MIPPRVRGPLRALRGVPLLAIVSFTACVAVSPAPQADSGGGSGASGVDRLSRPPAEFHIGNAVAPINSWMTAWTLNDVFRMAGFETEIGDTRPSKAWVPVIGGRWRMERIHDVPTDGLGWPTSLILKDGTRVDSLTTIVLGAELDAAFPAGTYRASWEGSATLAFEGVRSVERPGPGEAHLDYPGEGAILVSITAMDPSDPIRNLEILRPDATPGTPFNAAYIADIRPFSVIRPLHLIGDQLIYGPPIEWSERKPLEYSHWGGALGAPFEVAIDLASASESDLWLNVPIAASDAFVRELAALVRRRLSADRRVYVELGNELWNWAEPYALGRAYALGEARRRWPGVEGSVRPWSEGEPVNELMMLYSWQGMRSIEIGSIFREAFGGDAARVVVVLAGQIGASAPFWHPSRYLLESPVAVGEEGLVPAAHRADAFAVAPYVHEPEGGAFAFDRSTPEAYLADAIDYVRGAGRYGPSAEEYGLRYQIRTDRALAAEFDLPLIAYEGGQHFTGSRFTRDEVNAHPDMRDLYRTLFEVWEEEGGGLFVHFAGVIPRGQSPPGVEPGYYESENFGIKERQTDRGGAAPKWEAVREVMRRTGQL